jgi:hypothetical protein
MIRKIMFSVLFVISASLFYFVSAAWSCGVTTKCIITCYNASGVQIGEPESCYDATQAIHTSCECDTEYNGTNQAACHSHCSSTTGQDTFCSF